MIRIREKGLSRTKKAFNIFRDGDSYKDLENCLIELYAVLGIRKFEAPDIKRDMAEINNLYKENFKNNSLQALYPEVAKRWHPTKNGNLTPDQVTARSGRYAYFLCEKGHTYFQVIANAAAGHGCNKCSYELRAKNAQKRGLIVGVNDLATLFPEIAKEWDYESNEDNPQEYKAGSNKEKYWICNKCGRHYQKKIIERTKNDRGCPDCPKVKP